MLLEAALQEAIHLVALLEGWMLRHAAILMLLGEVSTCLIMLIYNLMVYAVVGTYDAVSLLPLRIYSAGSVQLHTAQFTAASS